VIYEIQTERISVTYEIQTERISVKLHSNCNAINGLALVCDHYVMSCAKVMVEQEQLAAEKQHEHRFRSSGMLCHVGWQVLINMA
jgi:hypothetical protein